jgi:fused signal recognition particle receptor
MGFFDKIKAGLTKTRDALNNTLGSVFSGFSQIDDDFYDELEESLILADLGVETATKATEQLRKAIKEQHLKTPEEAKTALKDILVEMLNVGDPALNLSTNPAVILVIGVNGVGKTTTIGKIATQLVNQGKKVLLVAGDTFRAAAADQLEVWAGRSGADIVRQHEGADPASVVYDGIQAARARNVDVIIIDTAGRLHNKANLMNELNKISRIVNRELPDAAKEVLLVLDGTTGQNGLIQAKQFKEIAGVTAIALTKLDGTAKGGIVIAVADQLQVPVKFVGVGEQADDLMPFIAKDFVDALI